MPRPYPPEFRARAVALVRAGKQAKQTAFELGIHPVTLSNWIRQTIPTTGAGPVFRPRSPRSCARTGDAFVISRPNCSSSGKRRSSSTRSVPAQETLPGDRSSRRRRDTHRPLLPGSRSRPTALLPGEAEAYDAVRAAQAMVDRPDPEVHVASRGTYGYRRVHAELTMAMGVTVSGRTVFKLMRLAGIYGLPGPVRIKRLRGVVTADDVVNRKFARARPNEFWVTDITQHRTREGWLYCAAVLDAYSRRIIGWSIDSKQDSTLVVNALDMAIRNRRPEPGGIVHADHGTQFTSWVFGEKVRSAWLLPSFGSVGDGLDNAMMESFWSSMQIELLNRKKWNTRVELANAIFEYIEIFHNRRRRHSSLGYRTQLNTRHSERTTSSPRVSPHHWNQKRGSGQPHDSLRDERHKSLPARSGGTRTEPAR